MKDLRTFHTLLRVAVLIGLGGLCTPATAADRQDLEQLRQSARHYLQDYYQNRFDAVEISVNRLDPRLRLPACQDNLAFDLRDLNGNGGAVSVKTQCLSATPWTIYIGAQIDIFQNVIVTRKALSRGDIVTRADLTHARMSSSSLRGGYFTDISDVLGKEVRRNLEPGEPLRDSLLTEPLAVSRGEIITLASTNGVIGVNTRAEALNNGRIGEQIRVRNLSSQRVVTASVVEPGRVEVRR